MDAVTLAYLTKSVERLTKSFERIADALTRLANNDDKRVAWLEETEKDTEPQR